MLKLIDLKDSELLELYRWWSEEKYCASFLTPLPETVGEFLDYLEEDRKLERVEDYEREFLNEARKQIIGRVG